jgi:two-component system, chemotaxis family, chemotaxis protein CheY
MARCDAYQDLCAAHPDKVGTMGHLRTDNGDFMNRLVLVVDDDALIRDMVSDILQYEGLSVETASNGHEALEVFYRTHPAVVLLDMRMPVMDGWGFARELRRRGEDTHLVVMTAAHDARRWANEVDAHGCLPKPFEIDDLLSAVLDPAA